MPSIHITLDDTRVQQSLQALLAVTGHLEPVYDEIGQMMQENISLGFRDQKTPSGNDWLQLSPVTLSHRRKHGRGAQILRDTGMLNRSITHNRLPHGVEVGSNLDYANMQNFGGKKADFPHLWGDIPARQFIPTPDDVQANDKDEITAIVERYLQRAAGSF